MTKKLKLWLGSKLAITGEMKTGEDDTEIYRSS